MHVPKLHRYVSRSGPMAPAVLAVAALEAAENEGWPSQRQPAAAHPRTSGHRPYGRHKQRLLPH